MSFARFPFTFASVLTTASVAFVAGVASVMWQPAAAPASNEPLPMSVAVFTETVEVVAPAEGISVDLSSARKGQQVGDDVVLEARLENVGTKPLLVGRDGVFDLFVQRTASPLPMGLSDVSFLALVEVVKAEPTLLRPGQTIIRTLRLGSTTPFDRPGRYVVGGQWHGPAGDVSVSPFELVLGECTSVACRNAASLRGGV